MEVKTAKRNGGLDFVRAACMLYIVAFWHLDNYLSVPIIDRTERMTALTECVLAAFTFLSAIFLGRNKIRSLEDAWSFYRKRLLRLYPLFAVSALSLYAMHTLFHANYIESLPQLFFTLTGLCVFYQPAPSTLWYISMLLLFYLFTPLILAFENRVAKATAAALLFGAVLLCNFVIEVDSRFFFYFPVYAVGLIFPCYESSYRTFRWKRLIVALLALILCFWLTDSYHILQLYGMFALFIAVLLEVGALFGETAVGTPLWVLSGALSYASMNAYLFHRQFWSLSSFALGRLNLWASWFILLPILLALSWITQFLYDKALLRGTLPPAQGGSQRAKKD